MFCNNKYITKLSAIIRNNSNEEFKIFNPFSLGIYFLWKSWFVYFLEQHAFIGLSFVKIAIFYDVKDKQRD